MQTKLCPICGGPLLGPYDLQDGQICRKCADDLRFQYPYLYLPRVGLLDEALVCQDLRRKDLTYLKKHREEALNFGLSGGQGKSYRFDLMSLLTLEQFRAQLPGADAREDQIRRQYLDYTNVLTVEFSRPLGRTIGKKGVQNLRRRKSGWCITGPIRAGAFREGDMVGILHQGQLRYADILVLYSEACTPDPEFGETRTRSAESFGDLGETGTEIRAGYQVTMILSEKARGIEPGDWIVTD